MKYQYPLAYLKAILLEGGTIKLSDVLPKNYQEMKYIDNHHNNYWMFFRLSELSRVRLTVTNDETKFILKENERGGLGIYSNSTGEAIVSQVTVENEIVHAPEQLFLGLYEYCNVGCLFCPISVARKKVHYSLDSIYEDIEMSREKPYTSIGITTAIPPHLSTDDVADEMIFIVGKIREKVGREIPIGVSTKIPSKEKMLMLKAVGASEIRLNLEVPNVELAKIIMSNKKMTDILKSIEVACEVFGKGKVSSNIILGLGESDEDVLEYVEKLAQMGAIATLYPYDPIDSKNHLTRGFKRPNAERLYTLAVEHKRILDKYGLDTLNLKTMCPSCAASHIFPGRDL